MAMDQTMVMASSMELQWIQKDVTGTHAAHYKVMYYII